MGAAIGMQDPIENCQPGWWGKFPVELNCCKTSQICMQQAVIPYIELGPAHHIREFVYCHTQYNITPNIVQQREEILTAAADEIRVLS